MTSRTKTINDVIAIQGHPKDVTKTTGHTGVEVTAIHPEEVHHAVVEAVDMDILWRDLANGRRLLHHLVSTDG